MGEELGGPIFFKPFFSFKQTKAALFVSSSFFFLTYTNFCVAFVKV